jgi:hypothetical protein
MNAKQMAGSIAGLGFVLLLLWALPVSAQTTFSSGSTGALGPFNPTTNTTVTLPPDGVLNYTTINIPSGVTVTFVRNAANTPVTMLATGDVTIAGTINVEGSKGSGAGTSTAAVNPGGLGGPGGFAGGQGGSRGLTQNAGSAGQGPGGGGAGESGTYGAPALFVSLVPLFGGSGGGGSPGDSSVAGTSGGGGGGSIVIASSTKIVVSGSIQANGGDDGEGPELPFGVCAFIGGAGSGGAIRLVAPEITVSGSLRATGGTSRGGGGAVCGSGGVGRIRIEAVVSGLIAPTTPSASTSNTLGPITANSTPALINLPTLTISTVGGTAAPATPTGSYSTADVLLPTGTTNPVPVTLAAQNIPLSTVFTVKLIPQFANPNTATCANTSGSFSVSTCTANTLNFPSGQVSVLNAYASFTLTASLFPLIDGEEVDRVMLAATFGEPSTVTLITKSGKEVRADQLPLRDQLAFAKGWEAMQKARD